MNRTPTDFPTLAEFLEETPEETPGDLAKANAVDRTFVDEDDPPPIDTPATTPTEPLLEIAFRLIESGLSVIPVKADGTKAPAVPWKQHQSQRATAAQIATWCRKGYGFAVVSGKVSGNLEILDFDDPSAFAEWCSIVGDLVLPTVITPIGGYHVYYRCSGGVEGNQKLAHSQDKKVLIETRGEGGYVLLPGSPNECHPLNKPYILVQGDLTKIPTISGEERSLLLESARALNEYVKPSQIVNGGAEATGNRPGDQFNARATWGEILEPHGWKKVSERGEVTDWRRPEKKEGISATTNFGGSDLFYNFSTNGHPFDADRAYTKFAAYTHLNHDGDFRASAAELAEKGYGISTPSREWPAPLTDLAFHGLAGAVVHTIEPHTEADIAALLIQFLVAFGNVVGRTPYFLVESDRHTMNLFAVISGETSKARKGTSWGRVRSLFEAIDSDWVLGNLSSGLSSGEGLIWKVRDSAVTDKRLLVMEGEFSSPLKVIKREGNTLSPTVRNAWDTGDLNTLVKNDPNRATGAHISILGHITNHELRRHLDDTEAGNGFGNRFLWVSARRSKFLPNGGNLQDEDLAPLIGQLRTVVEFARGVGEIKRDEEASRIWCDGYCELSEGKPGLLGAMIGRAESQVVRLSCIYALLDRSTVIRAEHLKAALAVWRYCEDSCRFIFGDRLGDPVADRILEALRNSPGGMTRTDINNLFKRNTSATRIHTALVLLEKQVLIRPGEPDTGRLGRPAEVWFAV